MDMIHEYIWFVVGGAAFVAFLLGLIIRGMMSAGKTRRATVERDVAITELEQVRSELDSLYAAQRKQREQAAATSAIAPEELKERDERLAQVSRELEDAKVELQALREARNASPEESAGSNEAGELQSRNAWLEERVGELEAKIHEMGQAPAASAEDEGPEQKKDWQIDFLKSRVAALEEKLVEGASAEAAPAEAPVDKAADEELARLRWRNRYLEGRLAYFEESPAEEAAAPPPAEDAPAAEEDTPEAAAEASNDTGEDVPDNVTPIDVATAPESEAQGEADASGEDEDPGEEESEHPSEKMLRALDASDTGHTEEPATDEEAGDADTAEDHAADAAPEDNASEDAAPEDDAPAIAGEAPPALDKPEGNADDLTLITGVGPRIQTILNELGIWHFSQIADWSPENETWIDDQLNFAGRVSREGWVNQARELVSANQKAD